MKTVQNAVLVLFAFLALAAAPASAKDTRVAKLVLTDPAPKAPAPDRPLRVFMKPLEPFVFERDGELVGFSVDLWKRVAEEAGLPFEVTMRKTVADLVQALEKDEADVGVAAVSITAEREKLIDFSTPFYEAGLQILVGAGDGSSTKAIVNNLLNPELLKLLLVVLVLLLITAHLLWLVERKRNPESFPHGYVEGLREAVWWTLSTGVSGGCENKAPVGMAGRIVAMFWMIVGVLLVSVITASVTSAMTLSGLQSDITGPSDLPGQRVATVRNSTAEKFLAGKKAVISPFDTFNEAHAALLKGKVKAVVFDAPILLYAVAQSSKSTKQQVVGPLFQRQSYGFGLQQGSPYRKKINAALLKLNESGYLSELQRKWFGEAS